MLLNLVVPHPGVLGLAETEIIFPSAALTVLYLAGAATEVLVTLQRIGYCRAVLAHHQQCLSNIPPPQGPVSG